MSSTTNDHSKTNKNLLFRMFGKKLNPTPDVPAADESASTMSGATLVQQQPTKPLSKEEEASFNDLLAKANTLPKDEQGSFNDLMAKANTMPPEEFKAYLARHKETVEAGRGKQEWGRKWQYSDDFVNNESL